MSRIQRTAAPSEGGVTTAKKPLAIVGKEIEVEGTTENKIPESDLSTPEMVKKTGAQSITGTKTFETGVAIKLPVAEAGGAPLFIEAFKVAAISNEGGEGTNAGGVELKLGGGGNNAAPGTATGGKGSRLLINTGEGGFTNSAKTSAIAGAGGAIEMNAGRGGEAKPPKGAKAQAGAGGVFIFKGGIGGSSNASEGLDNKGGEGSAFTLEGGEGGEANKGTAVKNTGGLGGGVVIKGGIGGGATTATETTTQGAGGPIKITGGEGHSGTGAAKGGAIVIRGGPAETAALSGAIELLTGTGAGTLRLKIDGEGNLTLPSEASTLKVAAPTAVAEYTSAKEETEAKATFITLVIVVKAEAAAATVKLVNSGEEISFKWDGVALGAQRVPLTLMVKKAGKWKATLEGSAEKAEISRVTMEP